MPTICEFYDIVIAMFHNDHAPPHFHAIYGEYRVLVGVDPVRVIAGSLPRRAQSMVIEWAASHQLALRENWERARAYQPLVRIEPLD